MCVCVCCVRTRTVQAAGATQYFATSAARSGESTAAPLIPAVPPPATVPPPAAVPFTVRALAAAAYSVALGADSSSAACGRCTTECRQS